MTNPDDIGVRRLWFAVLTRALEDATLPLREPAGTDYQVRKRYEYRVAQREQARSYLRFGSYIPIAEALGFLPEYMERKLREQFDWMEAA